MYLYERICRRRTCRGYIIEQLLITLLICAFMIPVTVVIVGTLCQTVYPPSDFQDEISIAQIRHVINVSYDVVCNGSECEFLHHDAIQRLALRNGKLCLLSPGTQIFLTELSDVSFDIEGNLLYLTYAHYDKNPETRCLGYIGVNTKINENEESSEVSE